MGATNQVTNCDRFVIELARRWCQLDGGSINWEPIEPSVDTLAGLGKG
jgi:hypothetical protein